MASNASGTAASGTAASGTAASGTAASGTAASGTAASGTAIDDAAAPSAGSDDDAVGAGVAVVGSPPPATIAIMTCVGEASDASATPDAGFSAFSPAECGDSLGPVHPVASAADVMGLLPGTWSVCAGKPFGMPVDAANGVALTSDSQFHLLGPSAGESLLPLDSTPDLDAGTEAGGGAGLSASGTYDVVDGTATYGPGTYELQLHSADGSFFAGQVLVTDSPRQLRYFEPNASPQTFSPSAPWNPPLGVCSCVDVQATKVSEYDPAGLAVAMTGRWLWCGNEAVVPEPLPPGNSVPPWLHEGPVMGIEFSNDGAWFVLREDVTGSLVRGIGALDQGMFQIVSSTGELQTLLRGSTLGAEPLSIELQTPSGTDYAQAIVTQDPRVLLLNAFNTDGALSYSIFFPIP